MFSKKATKFDGIFIDLTLCGKGQIDGEDFVNFCGLLRKHELYTGIFLALCIVIHSRKKKNRWVDRYQCQALCTEVNSRAFYIPGSYLDST